MNYLSLAILVIIVSAASVASQTASWDPATLARQDTLEFLTVGPQEGEHWSKVWVVAVDDQVYVRLGRRAAERFEKNTTAPFVKVRIAKAIGVSERSVRRMLSRLAA